LNPVSKKQKKRNSAYDKAKKEFYQDESNQKCFLCGTREGLSIHHKGKRGSNTANAEDFATLCLVGNYMDQMHPELNHTGTGGCHGFIHANPSWARANGLLY
jgi:hypothetical protein